jgi:hypothetical protein
MNVYSQDEIDLQIAALKQQYAVPILTKQQMYEDIDSFISTVTNCNPQCLIKKKVTGYDMIERLHNLRNQVEQIEETKDFIFLLSEMLNALQDQHSNIGTNVWWYSHSYYANDIKYHGITDRDFALNFHYIDFLHNDANYLNLFYVNGQYFLKYPTTFFYDNDSIIMPPGTAVMAFDNYSGFKKSLRCYEKRFIFAG